MSESKWPHTLEVWESRGEMTKEMAEVIDQEFNQLMEIELNQVETLLDKDKTDVAFTHLTCLMSFVNAASTKKPSIMRKLEKWVKRLKRAANKLGKKLGADSFSIGASIPLGISVEISFPIT